MSTNVHVTEGVGGTWHYHLSNIGTNARALCGAVTMNTGVPLTAWGSKGHLHESYCAKCAELGADALQQAQSMSRQG